MDHLNDSSSLESSVGKQSTLSNGLNTPTRVRTPVKKRTFGELPTEAASDILAVFSPQVASKREPSSLGDALRVRTPRRRSVSNNQQPGTRNRVTDTYVTPANNGRGTAVKSHRSTEVQSRGRTKRESFSAVSRCLFTDDHEDTHPVATTTGPVVRPTRSSLLKAAATAVASSSGSSSLRRQTLNGSAMKPSRLPRAAPTTVTSRRHSVATSAQSTEQSLVPTETITPPQPQIDSNPDEWDIDRDFSVIRPLGKGSFGNVYLMSQRSSGAQVAVKTLYRSFLRTVDTLSAFQREAEWQFRLRHPNIIRLFGMSVTPQRVYLLLEPADGGDLYRLLRGNASPPVVHGLAERQALKLIKQIASAIEYLHSHRLAHRDLKTENILLATRNLRGARIYAQTSSLFRQSTISLPTDIDNINSITDNWVSDELIDALTVKLADFGSLAQFSEPNSLTSPQAIAVCAGLPNGLTQVSRRYTLCGTVEYLSPEMVSQIGHGPAVDLWALGILLYEMVMSQTPFFGDGSQRSKMDEISNFKDPAHLKFECLKTGKKMSESCRFLVCSLLQQDEGKRMSAARVQEYIDNMST